MTRPKSNVLALAGGLMVPAIAAWVALIYICHTLATGVAVVLELFSRSL